MSDLSSVSSSSVNAFSQKPSESTDAVGVDGSLGRYEEMSFFDIVEEINEIYDTVSRGGPTPGRDEGVWTGRSGAL